MAIRIPTLRVFAFVACSVGMSFELSVVSRACAQTPATSTSINIKSSDWPWWRGPHVDGAVSEQKIPTSWSATENVLWKTDIPGRGHSSPIIVNGKVFLTTAEDDGQVQSL